MHEHRRLGRAAGLVLATLALVVPATALAQSHQWSGSGFEQPTGTDQRVSVFDVVGVFDVSSGTNIQRIDVTFGRMSDGGFTDQDGDCFPGDRDEQDGISIFRTDEEFQSEARSDGVDNGERVRFVLPDREWPCNGSFAIRATATQVNLDDVDPGAPDPTEADPDEPGSHTIVKELRVAVRPPSVDGVHASVAGNADPELGPTEENPEAVTVTWTKLGERPESEGYRIKRAGPATDGSFGGFTTVGEVPESGAASFEDSLTAPGEYWYQVVALRDSGVEQPTSVESRTTEASAAKVRVAGPAPEGGGDAGDQDGSGSEDSGASAGARPPLTLPEDEGGASGSRPNSSRWRPPTTVDTGFDETLDYGEDGRPTPTTGGNELAGEGQSVIRTEDEGAGLLGPAAGALVLLGWAGHVAYLNRLAKQF